MEAGAVAVAVVGAVDVAVIQEELETVVKEAAVGASVAHKALAGERIHQLLRPEHILVLGVPVAAGLVDVAVVADLVAAAADLPDHLRVSLGGDAGDEEGGGDTVLVQQVQDAGHALDGAIAAPGGVQGVDRGVVGLPEGLPVQVEGHHHRDTSVVGPVHGASPSPVRPFWAMT